MRSPTITRSLVLAVAVAAGMPAWADDECDVPIDSWQPRSAVTALAQRNGWEVDRLKIDDGCYEIKGRDAEGRRFKAKLDPATLDVVDMKRKRDRRERDREPQRAPVAPMPSASAPAAGS